MICIYSNLTRFFLFLNTINFLVTQSQFLYSEAIIVIPLILSDR